MRNRAATLDPCAVELRPGGESHSWELIGTSQPPAQSSSRAEWVNRLARAARSCSSRKQESPVIWSACSHVAGK